MPKSDEEKRRLHIAIQHATLIQDQKNVQQQNLNSIEELSDLPASAEPTTAEAETFRSLVSNFQPSDYDALIEERHANGRCGYTLCPNNPRTIDPRRSWLRPKGAQNWCSDECARKALYVKAQLDETPAWERRGGDVPKIVLRPESAGDERPARNSAASTQKAVNQSELALERGEKLVANKIDLVSTDIVEKETRVPRTPSSSVRFDDSAYQEIEGYRVSNTKHRTAENAN